MTELTIRLPENVLANIRANATRTGRPIEQMIVEALQNAFAPKPKPLSERDQALQLLVAAGLIRPADPALRRSVRHVSEQQRAALAKVFSIGRPLSEIVIEERGERL